MLSEQAEFAQHLFRQGYPLWSPDPSGLPEDRERDGIKIGDIGFVKGDGHFYLLFNICEAHREPSYPQTTSPLIQESEISGLDHHEQVSARSVITSPTTSWTVDPYHESNTDHPADRATLYHTKLSVDGSHIILPHGADSHEATPQTQTRFEALARQHGREWYRIAREQYGRGSDPLYLVTGLHKAVSWALASIRVDGGPRGGVRCNMVVDNERRILRDHSFWNPTGFPHKIGPARVNEGRKNQSVFISGIVITSRELEPKPKPQSVWLRVFPSFSKLLPRELRKDMTESADTEDDNGEVSIDHVPRIQQRASHPADIINRYLLTIEPSAETAITHDSRWLTLVEKGQISTIEDLERHVEQLVTEHYSINVENGTVYLNDKESIKQEGSLAHFGLDRAGLPTHELQSIIQVEATPFTGGELAEIYLGTLRTSDKPINVAIKVLRGHLINADGFNEIAHVQFTAISDHSLLKLFCFQRARRAIEVWLTLDHINLLPLIGTIAHKNSPFPAIVTPWIEHGNMSSYLNRSDHSLTDAEMLVLIRDVASALHYLHSRNIVHGCLSTSNILVNAQGRAFIDFFSLTLIVSAASPSMLHTSSSGGGILHWVAPELSRVEQEGVETVPTKETDVYAFGGIMLQILVPNYFQDMKAVRAALSGTIPERPDDPHLTDLRRDFIRRCFFLPVMRPSTEEIVEFTKHELPESVAPSGDLTDYKTLVADMDTSNVALGETSTSRTLVEVDISLSKLGIGESSKVLVSGAIHDPGLPLTDLTDSIKLENESPLAGGGFADVYEGILRQGDEITKAAIKVTRLFKDSDVRKMTMRVRYETRVWSMLHHDNILPFLGMTTIFGKIPAMVSPWMENGTLTSYLNHWSSTLTEMHLLSLIRDVASGIDYLHSKNIVHGDLSGPNVLVDASGRALIADFGLSALLGEQDMPMDQIRRGGTLRWTAPEVLNSQSMEPEDAKQASIPRKQSDIYSFGSLMLQILSGNVPYHNYRHVRLEAAVLQGVTPPRPEDRHITDHRWNFIRKCWSPLDLRPSSEEIVQFTEGEISRCSFVQTEQIGQENAPTTKVTHMEDFRHSVSRIGDDLNYKDLTGSITRDSEAPVGSGSFSDVYLGTYLTSNGSIKVAIKVVRLSYGDLAIKTRQRLQRELRVWSMFEHPNVLALLGITIGFGGLLGIVSPWAENGTLTSYLARQSHLLTDVEVLLMIADVASGLHYLHSQGVVHGNLSGGNVLVDASGRALLADFGTSAIYGELVQTVSTPSGTLRWMAPEALNLNESDNSSAFPTRQSDVYSFGGIMLQILSGKIPYHYLKYEHRVVVAVMKGIIPLRPNDARVTDHRWMFIQRCWSSPETRPSSDEIVLFSKNEITECSPPQV